MTHRFLPAAALTLLLPAVAACGGSAAPASTSAALSAPSASSLPSQSASAATSSAVAVGASASGAASGQPFASRSGAPVAATRLNGTVQTVSSDGVTLADGQTFQTSPKTRVVEQQSITAGDLKPGMFVAITAKRQPDNTLQASIVSVFPASLSSAIPAGQRPLPQGDLMTNASIDQITGNMFTVTFPGGGARVTIAPDAHILKQTDATAADVKAGEQVSAAVVSGVAQSITLM